MTTPEQILFYLLKPVIKLICLLRRSSYARIDNLGKRMAARLWHWRKQCHPGLPLPFPIFNKHWLLLPRNDVLGKHLWDGLPYEVGECELLARLLREGDIFIDLGANFGLFSILAASQVGRSGQVHAFEPSPVEFAKLEANLRCNGFKNTITNRMAVGKTAGEVVLNIFEDGWGAWNTIGNPPDDVPVAAVATSVPQTTLDLYIHEQNLSHIDFIKIDVEGSEINVFSGAGHVLAELRPMLLCELDEKRAGAFGHSAGELWDLLAAKDYLWYELPKNNAAPVPAVRQDEFLYVNLLAIPREKVELLSQRLNNS